MFITGSIASSGEMKSFSITKDFVTAIHEPVVHACDTSLSIVQKMACFIKLGTEQVNMFPCDIWWLKTIEENQMVGLLGVFIPPF